MRVAPLARGLARRPRGRSPRCASGVLSYPMYVGTLVTPRRARRDRARRLLETDAPVERHHRAPSRRSPRERARRRAPRSWSAASRPRSRRCRTRRAASCRSLALALARDRARPLRGVPHRAGGGAAARDRGALGRLEHGAHEPRSAFALTPWTAITAVLVLSVAAGHAVQILKRYYECYAELGDNRAAVAASLARIGPVMAIAAGFIAAAGFALARHLRRPRRARLRPDGGVRASCARSSSSSPSSPPCRVLLPRAALRRGARASASTRFLDPALDGARAAPWCARPGRSLAVSLAGGRAVARARHRAARGEHARSAPGSTPTSR